MLYKLVVFDVDDDSSRDYIEGAVYTTLNSALKKYNDLCIEVDNGELDAVCLLFTKEGPDSDITWMELIAYDNKFRGYGKYSVFSEMTDQEYLIEQVLSKAIDLYYYN